MNGFGFGFSAALGALLNQTGFNTPILLEAIVVSDTSIKLDWVNMSDDFIPVIEISTDNITFTQLAEIETALATYTVTGLTAFTQYYFRIKYKFGSKYCRVVECRTRPESSKYPFVDAATWNNDNLAIKDIRLYVPDESVEYAVFQCGKVGADYKISINEWVDGAYGTEVIALTLNAAMYTTTNDYIKIELSARTVIDQDIRGYIVVNLDAITGGVQYGWQQVNKPVIRQECISEFDPAEVAGELNIIDNSVAISPTNNLYAHESSVYADDDVLLVAYLRNTVNSNEDNVNQYNSLLIVDKDDYSQSTELIIAKGGETHGGVAFDGTKVISVPRIYKLSNGTIRIYFWYNFKTWYRDFDKTTQTLGNVYEFKAIISGGSESVELTSANIQAHCEAITSTTNAIFNSMYFLFRDAETYLNIGDGKLYCVGEFIDSNPGTFTTCFPVFMESADGGETFSLKGIAYLPVISPYRYLENNLLYDDGKFYLINRIQDYRTGVAYSSDSGATWSEFEASAQFTQSFPFGNYGLRKSVINYKAANLIVGNYKFLEYYSPTTAYQRTTLSVSYVTAMKDNKTRLIASYHKTMHYPSVAINADALYLSYTTADLSGGGQNTMKNTIRLTKIALKDL